MEKIKRNHYQNNGGIRVVRAADGVESRAIEGYAILFGSSSVPFFEDERSRVVEYIDPEAISEEFLRDQDVKMTLFHDMRRLLARSKRGQGSLEYVVDDRGVKFRFNAPQTADGDMALELVERGDIDGCSFMFSTYYDDRDFVSREVRDGADGKREIIYTVRKLTGIYDFTLTPDPAYPETSVNAAKRDISEIEEKEREDEERKDEEEKPEGESEDHPEEPSEESAEEPEAEPQSEEDSEEGDEGEESEQKKDCDPEKEAQERRRPFDMDEYMRLIKLTQ